MPLPPPDRFISALTEAATRVAKGHVEAANAAAEQLRVNLSVPARRPRISNSVVVSVLTRDGFLCRYCGCQTVAQPVLRAVSLLWPALVPYHPNWRTGFTHPLYVERSASVDHVVPHAHGGAGGNLDNLATACWPCNAQKGEFSLERLGWALVPAAPTSWDGLVGTYPAVWGRARPVATAGDYRYHQGWLVAFGISP